MPQGCGKCSKTTGDIQVAVDAIGKGAKLTIELVKEALSAGAAALAMTGIVHSNQPSLIAQTISGAANAADVQCPHCGTTGRWFPQ